MSQAKKVTHTRSTGETRALGKEFVLQLRPQALVCLQGELGAGKTMFVQGLLEGLGAEKPYSSPTFVIMKLYELTTPINGIARVYHTDAYRIDAPDDLARLGFHEWLSDPEGLVLLEWPERVAEILPSQKTTLLFSSKSENEREIVLQT